MTEIDGSSRNMLKIENGDGADWWSGLTLMNEYPGTDLIGDGSQPITMRVFADQAGDLNLELEADGAAPYIMNLPVKAGWNDLSFDVSGADNSVNWHKIPVHVRTLMVKAPNVAVKSTTSMIFTCHRE